MALIEFTNKGIYCSVADAYIDPWLPVNKAFITHGHSDHARYGSKKYIATRSAVPVIKLRLGSHIDITGVNYGEKLMLNGVSFSFHPAGHVIGSAQIRIEYKGEVWVVSGDYKTTFDGLSEAFEVVKCHHFITECTFGLPAFTWESDDILRTKINTWWQSNASRNQPSIIGAYALGKAQRILNMADNSIGPVYGHAAIENVNTVIRSQRVNLPESRKIDLNDRKVDYGKALIIAPPSAIQSAWADRFKDHQAAIASGWMAIRGTRRRRNVDTGFVVSDHADWHGLLGAVKETGAEYIYTTHGYTEIFARYLTETGYNAQVVMTQFGEDEEGVE